MLVGLVATYATVPGGIPVAGRGNAPAWARQYVDLPGRWASKTRLKALEDGDDG